MASAVSSAVSTSSVAVRPHTNISSARQVVPSPLVLRTAPAFRPLSARCHQVVKAQVAVQLGGSASDEHNKAAVGDKVRVVGEVTAFHVPGVKQMSLQGQEGIVKEIVTVFKGKPISANLPYKVAFDIEVDGAKKKFFAHFKDDEIEVS
eukprot:TRINITY_DN70335_c0_g1_i1.p1 TRINITY_DN70335_c0_g1~~TRINITY_DN70335_c0_g1_i1.p1  ORF type:complete len:149 (-),score=12.01 TRINITY_DN70335_c0_g1_i1:110-556(-)